MTDHIHPTTHILWLAAFLAKDFIVEFSRSLADRLAERAARAGHYIRGRRRK